MKETLYTKVNRVAKALARLAQSNKPLKADLNMDDLTAALQKAADDELNVLTAETAEELYEKLMAVIRKMAPSAAADVEDEVKVVVYVVMNNQDFKARLNGKAKKAAIKELIALLRAILLQE